MQESTRLNSFVYRLNNTIKNNKILTLFSVIAGLFVTLAIIGGFRNFSPVPFWDMWTSIDFYNKISSGDWGVWWNQHNEHRIFLTRIFFWIDFTLFKAQGPFLIVCNYLLAGLGFFIVYNLLRENLETDQERFTRHVLGLVILCLLFSWTQNENLISPFQSQFFLVYLMPLAAFLFLHKASHSDTNATGLFFIASLLGFVSIGTMANGIFTLPLMVVLAILLRMKGWQISFLLVLSIIELSLYLYGFKSVDHHGSFNELAGDPIAISEYLLLYLGSPFYYFPGRSLIATQLAGAFLIGSSLYFAWKAVKNPGTSSLQLTLLTFLVYVGGSAFITAWGRVSLGLEQALSSRYTTPALLAWSILLVLYAPMIARLVSNQRVRILPMIMLPLLLLPKQFHATHFDKETDFNKFLAVLALELGVRDEQQFSMVFPSADYLVGNSTKAIDENISIFGHPLIKDARVLLGQKIEERAPVQCAGSLGSTTVIETDPNYLRLEGLIINPVTGKAPPIVYILNSERSVVGYALTRQPHRGDFKGFKGYLRADQLGKPLILQGSKSECALEV